MPHLRLPAFLVLSLVALCSWAQVDTATIVAGIRARMREADQGQVGGVFIRMPDQEATLRIAPDSPGPEDCLERYELYCDEYGTILGIGTFITPTSAEVSENSTHYFDADGNTIAVCAELIWSGSRCADSLAHEARYTYFHPADSTFMKFTTLTNDHGVVLDPGKCTYPDVERHFDLYLSRDEFLRAKRIKLE